MEIASTESRMIVIQYINIFNEMWRFVEFLNVTYPTNKFVRYAFNDFSHKNLIETKPASDLFDIDFRIKQQKQYSADQIIAILTSIAKEYEKYLITDISGDFVTRALEQYLVWNGDEEGE